MKRTGLPFLIAMVTALTFGLVDYGGHNYKEHYDSTPNMPSSHGQSRFRRKAENGKWSMRCHRGRVK